MVKNEKKRRYTTYKNSRLSNMEDKLLFILIYLRHAWTQDAQGMFFNMSQPETNKWIHLLSPILDQALDELGELPSREATPETFRKETEVESDTQAPEHFFKIAQSVRYGVRKTHKHRRTIIVGKRNNIL